MRIYVLLPRTAKKIYLVVNEKITILLFISAESADTIESSACRSIYLWDGV